MLSSDIRLAAGVSVLLFALALAAGPMIGVGALVAMAGVALICVQPVLGLAAMILSGTALQVLGSEHLTGLPMSLGKASGIVTLAAWGLRGAMLRTRLTYSPQLPALLAFLGAVTVSMLLAPDRLLGLDGLFRTLQLALLFFMIASLAGERRHWLAQTCLAVTACMVVASMIGLAEYFLPSLAIEYDDPSLIEGSIGAIIDHDSVDGIDVKRITGGLSDSNWFAYTVVSLLPLNLYLLHRYRGVAARLLLLGATALEGGTVVLSLTRSALIAGGLGIVVLLVRRRLPLAPILSAVIVGAAAFVVWNPPGLQRLYSAQYAQQGSTPLREYLLQGGVELIRERPVLGYGYGGYGPAFMRWLQTQHPAEDIEGWAADIQRRVDLGEEALENIMPHNMIIQIWVEYGLIGLSLFGLFVAGMVRDIATARRYGSADDALLADCLLAGLATFAVCALFGHLALLKIVWILGGLAAALRRVALTGAALNGAALR